MRSYDFLDANTFVGVMPQPETMSFQTVSELVQELDYYRIDEALVTHSLARDYQPAYGNTLLLEEIAAHPRLHPCWVLPLHPFPDDPPVERMVEEMLQAGVRVTRVYPPNRVPLTVTPWLGYEVFRVLEGYRVPLLLTDSDLGLWPDQGKRGFTAEMVYELCKQFPRLPIIVVRFNYQLTNVIYPLLREFDNLYLEISNFTTHRGIELIVKEFGNRFIFGSGMPMQNAGSALAILRYAAISEEQKRDLAGCTLRALMNEVK